MQEDVGSSSTGASLGFSLPVGFTSTILLSLLGVGVDEAGLRKVARETLFWIGSAIDKALVVTVVDFVRASHCWCVSLL